MRTRANLEALASKRFRSSSTNDGQSRVEFSGYEVRRSRCVPVRRPAVASSVGIDIRSCQSRSLHAPNVELGLCLRAEEAAVAFANDQWTKPVTQPDGKVTRERNEKRWGRGKRWLAVWTDPQGKERSRAFDTKVQALRCERDRDGSGSWGLSRSERRQGAARRDLAAVDGVADHRSCERDSVRVEVAAACRAGVPIGSSNPTPRSSRSAPTRSIDCGSRATSGNGHYVCSTR